MERSDLDSWLVDVCEGYWADGIRWKHCWLCSIIIIIHLKSALQCAIHSEVVLWIMSTFFSFLAGKEVSHWKSHWKFCFVYTLWITVPPSSFTKSSASNIPFSFCIASSLFSHGLCQKHVIYSRGGGVGVGVKTSYLYLSHANYNMGHLTPRGSKFSENPSHALCTAPILEVGVVSYKFHSEKLAVD